MKALAAVAATEWLNVQCTVTRPGSAGRHEESCTGAYRLRDGVITLATAIMGETGTIRAAVTGGTRAYAAARGTLTSVSHKSGGATDRIELLP